jgi:uncharacterized protein
MDSPPLVPPALAPATAPQEPRPGIWGFWPTIGLSAAVFATYFVVQGLVAVGFLLARLVGQQGLDLSQLVQSLQTDGLLISITTITSALAGLGLIALFIKLRGMSVRDYLGLRALSGKAILGVLGVFVLLFALLTLLGSLVQTSSGNENYMVQAFQNGPPVLLWLAVVLFAPAFEESFFRGFLLLGLARSKAGPVVAVLVTALFWASLHLQYDIYGMATILIMGLVFGIVRLRTRSLWSTLTLHALWNAAALIGTILSIRGQ